MFYDGSTETSTNVFSAQLANTAVLFSVLVFFLLFGFACCCCSMCLGSGVRTGRVFCVYLLCVYWFVCLVFDVVFSLIIWCYLFVIVIIIIISSSSSSSICVIMIIIMLLLLVVVVAAVVVIFESGRSYPAGTWLLYNVGSTSMQRHDVASTLSRGCINVMCLLGKCSVPRTHINKQDYSRGLTLHQWQI